MYDYKQANKLNSDLWALLSKAVKERNIPAIADNLDKFYALQKFYISKINRQDILIQQLKDNLQNEIELKTRFEIDWLSEISKRNGSYDDFKNRVNEVFKRK